MRNVRRSYVYYLPHVKYRRWKTNLWDMTLDKGQLRRKKLFRNSLTALPWDTAVSVGCFSSIIIYSLTLRIPRGEQRRCNRGQSQPRTSERESRQCTDSKKKNQQTSHECDNIDIPSRRVQRYLYRNFMYFFFFLHNYKLVENWGWLTRGLGSCRLGRPPLTTCAHTR